MKDRYVTDLMLLKKFRQCAHIQHRIGHFQGQGRILTLMIEREQYKITQRELADITQRRPATLSEQLEIMEKAGLITREKCVEDRRNIDISLTEKGRLAAVEAEKERKEIAALLFSKMDENEKLCLYELLLKLNELWQDIDINEQMEEL